MFDPVTASLLDQLPEIGELDGTVVRTRLTEAYLRLMAFRSSDRDTAELVESSIEHLREMANGLELFCLIEYANGQQLSEAGRAAAFVAAQSLELLSELLGNTGVAEYRHVLADPAIYSRLESGLLYLIAGYYANSRVVANLEGLSSSTSSVLTDLEQVRRSVATSLAQILSRLLRLDTDSAAVEIVNVGDLPLQNGALGPTEVAQSIESKLMYRLDQAIRVYLDFLRGQDNISTQDALDTARSVRQQIEDALSLNSRLRVPSEALLSHHLASLLEVVFGSLTEYATAHVVNPPPDSDTGYQSAFRSWIQSKVRVGYALLWYSTREWLRQRETPRSVHTVVSMPTGSGKGWLAELQLVARLWTGWGIYLAPTNALVRQIRDSLRESLRPLDIEIRSFLTEEHTTLDEENLVDVPLRTIVVMTPEKATLAFRLHPNAFHSCSVCVFDECHLIGQGDRGATSEYLVSRLINNAPNIHIMLMSAMLANPERLADWLASASGAPSTPVRVQWKPTRNLRTLAYIHSNSASLNSPSEVEIHLYGFAEIAWQQTTPRLAVDSPIGIRVPIERDDRSRWKWGSSVNVVARDVAVNFVRSGSSSLLFIHTSPHHVWTHARDCDDLQWQSVALATHTVPVIYAWLVLAEAELGQASPLRDFISRGVTVHSSALIDEERYASELAYSSRHVGLMVATGTLAQGLNFPTQVVVMAGTRSYSGVRVEDILNSLGRSGRAGFYNAGLAVVVPNSPLFGEPTVANLQGADAYTRILEQDDACVTVESALRRQLDQLLQYSNLMEGNSVEIQDVQSANVLENATKYFGSTASLEDLRTSLAAFQAEDQDAYLNEVYTGARRILEGYQHSRSYPGWLTEVASQAGLSVALMYELLAFLDQPNVLDQLRRYNESFGACLNLFQQAISPVSPFIIQETFGPTDDTHVRLRLESLPDKLGDQDFDWSARAHNSENWRRQWARVFELTTMWMTGHDYFHIACSFYDARPDRTDTRSDRSPIKRAVVDIRSLKYRLAHVCGGFVMLATRILLERGLAQSESEIPLALGMLPQGIRWGVDGLSAAFWYYNLLPTRVVAHTMSNLFPVTYENDAQIKQSVEQQSTRIRQNVELLAQMNVSGDEENVLASLTTLLATQ